MSHNNLFIFLKNIMGIALDELEGKISLEEASPHGYESDLNEKAQDDNILEKEEMVNDIE